MEVKRLLVADTIMAIDKLTFDHYAEVQAVKTKVPFELDTDAYLLLEQAGYILCLVLFDEEEVVGYLVATSSPMLHNCGHVASRTDCFYVKPEYRDKGGFSLLLDEYIRHAKAGGVDEITVACNESFTKAAEILESKGGYLSERVYRVE